MQYLLRGALDEMQQEQESRRHNMIAAAHGASASSNTKSYASGKPARTGRDADIASSSGKTGRRSGRFSGSTRLCRTAIRMFRSSSDNGQQTAIETHQGQIELIRKSEEIQCSEGSNSPYDESTGWGNKARPICRRDTFGGHGDWSGRMEFAVEKALERYNSTERSSAAYNDASDNETNVNDCYIGQDYSSKSSWRLQRSHSIQNSQIATQQPGGRRRSGPLAATESEPTYEPTSFDKHSPVSPRRSLTPRRLRASKLFTRCSSLRWSRQSRDAHGDAHHQFYSAFESTDGERDFTCESDKDDEHSNSAW
ncbi:hypothetical protein THASP1DRAFT_31573 [Thamnocephalis sphaerospora]|uniref:Uncharacterized protein n=1 Tax=Thamnocephalis sphaerospora TaxID=78915 RepID=A0A4P9XMK6_9FUNG|nr:hypothetical protein THASP1DRAFT_31958 [Thamnocephalis sphaerospora]RKP06611.1 hypothetical protein THASP1DRAFT_31573 [Thamnocephalis sphaerospora]|eukprot:RKP06221.1 hypothetical protein THASP1DRAFT_31958 [Thamnocephalis sphaerospora]